MDQMRLPRAGLAEDRGERVRTVFPQKVGEEIAGRHLAPGCFGDGLKRLADRRADLEIPVAVHSAKQAVGDMLGERIDNLADRARIPAEIVAHHAALFSAM